MIFPVVCIVALALSSVSAEWRGFAASTNFIEPEPKPNLTSFLLRRTSRQSDEVTLFDHSNYRGDSKSVRIPGSGCTNVLDFNDRTSSIKIDDGCVRLWQDVNCQGRSVDIQSPGESHLPTKDFNDETTSISSCDFPCFKENVEIVLHLNGANDLAEHAEAMKRMMQEWFPFIQGQLSTPAYRSIPKIDVYFDVKDEGIYAIGREIHIPQGYVRNNRGDTGVFIHEMTHVIHQARGCPGWAVEGTAEYMRRWFYEPMTTPTKPTDQNLSNAYLGDWLLYYVTTITKRPLFYMITKACQEGSWRDNWMRDMTGKDENEWWRQMVNDNEFPWKRVR